MKKISKRFSAPITINDETIIVCGVAYRWPDEDPKQVDEFDFDIDEVYHGNENIITALKALNWNDIKNYRELKVGAHDYIVNMFRNEQDWKIDAYFVIGKKIEVLVYTDEMEESKNFFIELFPFMDFIQKKHGAEYWSLSVYETRKNMETIYSDIKEFINSQNIQVI